MGAKVPGSFWARIVSEISPNIAGSLAGILAGNLAFSLAVHVEREITSKSHILADNVGVIAGNLLVILAAF
jgi:hypothetical protein